jgi:hypothetical protein
MNEQKHPEYEEVEQETNDVEMKLTTAHISVRDYREHVEKVNTYFKLIDEVRSVQRSIFKSEREHIQVERWHQDSSQLLVRIGAETMNCQTEHDARDLLNRVSIAIDKGKEYEREKMKHITTLAIDVFGV